MSSEKWVEIINVRLSSQKNSAMVTEIIDHVWSGRCPETGKMINAELYLNGDFELDWSIHLIRTLKDGIPRKTLLGTNIADLFADIGLVNHSVWKTVIVKRKKGRLEESAVCRWHGYSIDDTGGHRKGGALLVKDITEDEKIRKRLIQSEKMMCVGGLARGIAHEIRA